MLHTEYDGDVCKVVFKVPSKKNLVQHTIFLFKKTAKCFGFCMSHHNADIKIVQDIIVSNYNAILFRKCGVADALSCTFHKVK